MKSWFPGLTTFALLAIIPTLFAADGSSGVPGGNIGYNAAVASLLADIPAFSGDVETALTNQTDNSRLTIPMRMLKRDGKLRIEVDFVKIKGAGLGLQGLSAMQNIGMSRMTSLVTPQDPVMIVLFPDLKSYTRVNLSDTDVQDSGFKISKRASGKETVHGQPCLKQVVSLTGSDGKKVEATTWEAPALSNFPLRMYFKQKEGTMVMTYNNVSLAPPAADLFQVPADYKAHDSMSALMQDAMTRVVPPGPAGKSK